MNQLFKDFTKQNIIRAVTASVIVGLLYAVITGDQEYARAKADAATAVDVALQYELNAKRYEIFRAAYLKNCRCMQNASVEEVDAVIDAEMTAVLGL